VRKRLGSPAPWVPNLTARRRGTLAQPTDDSSPRSRLSRSSCCWIPGCECLPAADFGALVHLSRHTLYAWKRRFEQQGRRLMEQRGAWPRQSPAGVDQAVDPHAQDSHPDWGCQRISDMLVRVRLAASPRPSRACCTSRYEMEERLRIRIRRKSAPSSAPSRTSCGRRSVHVRAQTAESRGTCSLHG